MTMESVAKVDFNVINGKVKPKLHGSNCSQPYSSRWLFNMKEELSACNFTFTRTHDWPLWNPGQRVIDTHFIFPLMHLDPKDPKNYYFRATDAMIKDAQDIGMKIFYRLGTSIEQNSDIADEHNNSLVPEDFEQYAEVMAGIVRHYTQGWADGFYYDIEYWELWNEAGLGTQTWCGTKEEFAEFFVTVVRRLKQEFPNLKIGGPAFHNPMFDYSDALLTKCKETGVVPDFYSFHHYGHEPDTLIELPGKVRKYLDSYGFTETELSINEWHYTLYVMGIIGNSSRDLYRYSVDGPMGACNITSAVYNLVVLSGWHYQPLETACYYGASPDSNYGFRDKEHRWNKCYYSMRMFGEIVTGYTDLCEVKLLPLAKQNIRGFAAKSADGKKMALLLMDYKGREATSLSVEVEGIPANAAVTARVLDNDNDMTVCPVMFNGKRLVVNKNDCSSAAYLIEFEL